MTQPLREPDSALNRFPLSFTQEFFCSLDQGDQAGAFSLRFILVNGWRIAGGIDFAELQGALDDVVARHELLRTVVVRDEEPPYQQVHPPCPVPLEIRDLSPVTDRPRDVLAEELIIEAEQSSMDPTKVPLLRAVLGRFDDRDSVLVLVTHHSASDGWSMQVIMRDLAAFYAARTGRRPLSLPVARQYREYAAWQRARATDQAVDDAHEYWRATLRGARAFALPTDRSIPKLRAKPYSVHNFAIDAETVAAISTLANSMRSSPFMVLLAAFNVLAYKITGTTDPVIRAFTNGRNEPQFHETMGLFLNLVPFRTDIGGCATFRQIVGQTRDTCIEAYSHEIPIAEIEREMPELNQPHEDARMSPFAIGLFQPQLEDTAVQIADGSYEIRTRMLPEPEHPDIPNGVMWSMIPLLSRQLVGSAVFGPDEYDECTMVGWVAEYLRIISRCVRQPDRAWKEL